MAYRAWLEKQMKRVDLPIGEAHVDKDLLSRSQALQSVDLFAGSTVVEQIDE